MNCSLFTPVYQSAIRFLPEAYESLKKQTIPEWEWVILCNAGARASDIPEEIRSDPRVKVHETQDDIGHPHNKIGRLKKEACNLCTGDILVEFDCDDILVPHALHALGSTFAADTMTMFAYSNNAHFKDGTWETEVFSEAYGWKSRAFEYEGHPLIEMVSFPPTAQAMRYIYWAPDHVRAWRALAYKELGGHNPELLAGDDHELVIRTYLKYGERGMKHIDDCLYLYRRHPENSYMAFNKSVQDQTKANYLRYSRSMAVKWADEHNLRKVDLGGRFNAWEGFTTVDIHEPADIIHDLNTPFPFPDSTVGVLRASHIFEHLNDPIHAMNEAWRVLAPGGWLFVEVPSTDGRGAFQDPTHKTYWNENSFLYYTNMDQGKYITPERRARFQASRVVTYYPNDWYRVKEIPVVQADLIALKPPYDERPPGGAFI